MPVPAAAPQAATQRSLGQALFLGLAPMQGKPRGHVDSLPPTVVRCVNCHGVNALGSIKLTPELLLETRGRRHGPPSAYDAAKLCGLLRTGADPATILIDHAMPIYVVPDTACRALWTYLTLADEPIR